MASSDHRGKGDVSDEQTTAKQKSNPNINAGDPDKKDTTPPKKVENAKTNSQTEPEKDNTTTDKGGQ